MRIIGLDIGESRIGIAVTDPLGKTSQPMETIEKDSMVLEKLSEIAERLGAERVVVGLPLLMDGSEGKQAALVREFALQVKEKLRVPVSFIDERLTTRQAENVLAGEKLGTRRKRHASDKVAASLILKAYLDLREQE